MTDKQHLLEDLEREACREEGREQGRLIGLDEGREAGILEGRKDRDDEIDALKHEISLLNKELEKHTGCCAGGDHD